MLEIPSGVQVSSMGLLLSPGRRGSSYQGHIFLMLVVTRSQMGKQKFVRSLYFCI